MSGRNKKTSSHTRALIILPFAMVGFIFLMKYLLAGKNVALLDPKGLISGEQLNLMLFSVGVMLVIAVPTLLLLYSIAWKYRETNPTATYNARTRHGKSFVFSLWAIPTVFMIVLASVMWPATHKLEPQKTIAADAKTMTIQVVALRWKWLFIYPEQKIATVNYVQIPTDTPIRFELTADEAPMNSFWIPHLGGQLYAMTGHVNRLNLMAEEPGEYPGSAAEINGPGFAGMKFVAHASSQEDFDAWVQRVRLSSETLNTQTYEHLVRPSENNSIVHYASVSNGLYDNVLTKYAGAHDHQPEHYEAGH